MKKVCSKCKGKKYLPARVKSRVSGKGMLVYVKCDKCQCIDFSNLGVLESAQQIGSSVLVEKINKNVFVKCDMDDLYSHLRFVKEKTDCSMVILGDNRLFETYLTKDPQFTSFTEWNGYDVAIFILGVIGTPNKAVPGVLWEAILSRMSAGKNVWVNLNRDLESWILFHMRGEYRDLLRLIEKKFEVVYFNKKGKKSKDSDFGSKYSL